LGLSLLPWLWLVWRYEDWRNDYYVVTQDRIIDVDRLPFGFGGEVREAPMANVQNVLMRIPNFLAASLNFGDIEVETAGRTGGLVFRSIQNPRQVMAQVAARVEGFREARLARERAMREKEMLTWFSLYADLGRVAVVQSPPSVKVGERVEIEWRVSGTPGQIDTWLEWGPAGDLPQLTPLQSGGVGNYRDSFVVPPAREVPFLVRALIDGQEYRSQEYKLPVSDFRLECPEEVYRGQPLIIRWRFGATATSAEVLWDFCHRGREEPYNYVSVAEPEGDWYTATLIPSGEGELHFRLRIQVEGYLLHSPEYSVSLRLSSSGLGTVREGPSS
jgi:hypothetical protein